MASSPSIGAQPTPGILARARGFAILLILLVLFVALIGTVFLPNPYFAIGQGFIIVIPVALVVAKFRTCLRLAQGSEYSAKLHMIALAVFVGVCGGVILLLELSATRNFLVFVVIGGIFLFIALLSSLELVEHLLKRVAGGTGSADASATSAVTTTPPN